MIQSKQTFKKRGRIEYRNDSRSQDLEWHWVVFLLVNNTNKGRKINQIQFQKSNQLDINNYAPKVYYTQLTSNEEVLNYKFIKK